MRALLERSRSACAAVVLAAVAAVGALAQGASAGDDLGIRRLTLWPPELPSMEAVLMPDPIRPRRLHARRVWAASRSRPLRITLARARRATHVAASRRPVRVAVGHRPKDAPVVFPKLAFLPKPPVPALVSIYEDRTLRSGDAVMMADGVHVFRGASRWPYAPGDFARLTKVAGLGWHLRRSLDALDEYPPTRWSSLESPAG